MENKNSCKSAFTLIELLVVVLIIGILASIALPQYQKAVLKSHFVQAMTACDALYLASERYFLANSDWPRSIADLDVNMPGAVRETPSGSALAGTNFSCSLFAVGAESASASIMCSSKGIGLRRFFTAGKGKRYCYAKIGNEMPNTVCKIMSKTQEVDFTSGSYNYYLLP